MFIHVLKLTVSPALIIFFFPVILDNKVSTPLSKENDCRKMQSIITYIEDENCDKSKALILESAPERNLLGQKLH